MYRLVIVEDRDELRYSLCNYIMWDTLGFEVCADFGDGLQALEYVAKHPVDVVLSDIVMPVMSGLEFAKQAFERKYRFKTVLLSAYEDFAYAKEALVYGVKDYIVKPATYDDFAKAFGRVRDELDQKQERETPGEADPAELNYHKKLVRLANEYVQANFREATLETVADYLHINSFYFSRLYKRLTQVNFSDYLNEVKMKKAASLLEDVRYRSGEISGILGYSNPNNFARAFKKYYSVSPSEYRDGIKKEKHET